MSVDDFTADRLDGRKVITSDGEKLGKVDGVLTDDMGRPQYLEVKTGWFGSKRHAIPIQQINASLEDDSDIVVPYTKEQLENAPTLDDDEDLDYDREQHVGRHYGTPVREWDDTRDRWLAEEDLSRGPTPPIRHPAGGLDSPADTTQGPTPETRGANRVADRDDAAAGQPEADRETRHGGGIRHDDVRRDDTLRDDVRRDDTLRDDVRDRDREMDRGTVDADLDRDRQGDNVSASRRRLRRWDRMDDRRDAGRDRRDDLPPAR